MPLKQQNVLKTCAIPVILQGFGMMLMEEAERIARDEHGTSKLAVISGETASSHIGRHLRKTIDLFKMLPLQLVKGCI